MKSLPDLMGKCVSISAVVLAGTLTTATADAASCPGAVTITGGLYELSNDYEGTGFNTTCFNFSGSGIVDLKGHTLTTTGSNAGVTAIQCNSSVQVRDSGNPTTGAKGQITGTFHTALKNCHDVDGIRITGGAVQNGIWTLINAEKRRFSL